MSESFSNFFRGDYMPHGHCYLWQPGILWTNVISDLLIAIAYFSIPIFLLIYVKRKKANEFKSVFLLFAAFILCCGITHLFSIWTIWHGTYGLHGLSKAVTAFVSILTAWTLFTNIKSILAIPSRSELETALNKAAEETLKRKQLEIEKRAEAIFKFALELLPTGLLVVDAEKNIQIANKALENMFGYEENELKGKALSTLLLDEQAQHHNILVDKYVNHPEQNHSMASGRLVRGRTKTAGEILVEISLSVHEFQGEKHAFASVVNVAEVDSEEKLFFERSNRLQRAIDASNTGVWEWNIQNNQVWFSPRLMTMIGQVHQEPKPSLSNWLDHVHPQDKDIFEHNLKKHLAHSEKYDVIYRGLNDESVYQWVHARGDTIFDEKGTPLLMSGTLTNINELKTLELEIEEKNQFLDAVLNKSLSGMLIFDFKAIKAILLNEQYTKLTGYTIEDLNQIYQKEGLFSLFHPDEADKIREHRKNVIYAGPSKTFSIEYRFKHKNDGWVWFLSKDSVYAVNDDGEPTQILSSFVDITKLKQREEKIKQLALDFSTTFEQAAVGIAHVSLDGTWLKVNSKLCNILGYNMDELLTTSFQTITYPDDLSSDMQQVEKLIQGQADQYSIEKRYIHKKGHLVWTLLTVAIVRNEDREASHFISVIEDITERKTIEEALLSSNKSLERFAYSVSHDLQEPLRKISAFSESISEKLTNTLTDENALYELSRIGDAATRMREMINGLLQISRYSQSKAEKEVLYLSELISEVKNDLSTLLSKKETTITIKQDQPIWVEKISFVQLLRNIIANSIRYAKDDEPCRVDIEAHEINGFHHLLIKDYGKGFAPEFKDEIFEPFKRLVGKTSPGHGLGLAICKQIVLAHDGLIKADSKLNNGVEITIKLPLKD